MVNIIISINPEQVINTISVIDQFNIFDFPSQIRPCGLKVNIVPMKL